MVAVLGFLHSITCRKPLPRSSLAFLVHRLDKGAAFFSEWQANPGHKRKLEEKTK